jgi:hypothetical protein
VRILFACPVLAAIQALAVALRLAELGQWQSPRLAILVAIGAAGAGLAGLMVLPLLGWISRRFGGWQALVLAALVIAPGAIAASGLVFALYDRLYLGHIEEDALEEDFLHAVVFSQLSALYLFATTGLRYFLPWPALVVTLAAIALMRWLGAPRKS